MGKLLWLILFVYGAIAIGRFLQGILSDPSTADLGGDRQPSTGSQPDVEPLPLSPLTDPLAPVSLPSLVTPELTTVSVEPDVPDPVNQATAATIAPETKAPTLVMPDLPETVSSSEAAVVPIAPPLVTPDLPEAPDKPLASPILTNPLENSPADGSEAAAEVTGTILYLMRIALPPDAIAEVVLIDPAYPLAEPIATQTIALAGQQVPVAFSLAYNPAQIQPDKPYAIEATLTSEIGLLKTKQPVPVITQGNPSQVELMVFPIQTEPAL
jgi:uncharacterized lipoprotein YbaY